MGKLLAISVAATGAMAASVGGVFLFRGNGVKAENVSQTVTDSADGNFQPKTLSDALDFTTLADFKTKKGGSCVEKYFGSLNYESKGNEISTSSPFSESDFPGTSSPGENPKSCLIINWEKSISTSTEDSSKDK